MTKQAKTKSNPKMQTEWNLKLLYKSPKDPAIERDAKAIERAFAAFEKKYRGKNFTKDETTLATALKDYEKLLDAVQSGKPIIYFAFIKKLNSEDNEAEAQMQRLNERFVRAGNKVQFFDLALGKIPDSKQKKFLRSKKLERYRYLLERTFATAQYDLSEPEEKILSLKATPARNMWVDGVEALLNKQTVPYKGKIVPIGEALNLTSKITDATERRQLSDAIMQTLESMSDFAESEVNAVFTDKKINDELRGLEKPYTNTIIRHETNEKSVMALVKAVTDRYDISRRFMDIKRRMLGLSQLTYGDRAAKVGKNAITYPFPEAVRLTREAFANAGDVYSDIFDTYLMQGQIDVFPKAGKDTGGFASACPGAPTFILLNHVDDLRSLGTLAHEMGHAIHFDKTAKTQPIMYWGCSTAVAETASTFFEGLAVEHTIAQLSAKERAIALHDKIQDDVATVFRQIAFFNFELELHRAVRKEGWIPKERIAALFAEHMRDYLGNVTVKELDGYSFVYISHFRRMFYVYTYAFGQLVSKVLLARHKEDPSYINEVDKFLCAGRSKSPEQIFKDIGVDISKPAFWKEGLKSIERDVDELERLVK